MELTDEIRIAAPKDAVYRALNDPDVLRECIPGCEELIQHSPEHLEAKVVLKIGPVKARFNGEVTLDNSQAPDAFSLSGEGKGGAAGFANGGAHFSGALHHVGWKELMNMGMIDTITGGQVT